MARAGSSARARAGDSKKRASRRAVAQASDRCVPGLMASLLQHRLWLDQTTCAGPVKSLQRVTVHAPLWGDRTLPSWAIGAASAPPSSPASKDDGGKPTMHHDAQIVLSRQNRLPEDMAAILRSIRINLDENPALALHHIDRLSAALNRAAAAEDPVERALLPDRPAAAERAAKGGLAGWQLRRVTDHIKCYIDMPLTTDMLAASIHVSTGHFCRAFKTAMGETPHNHVIRQRLRHAQTLMLRTDETLSQIAFACGLTDQAHLTRLFRRTVGTTPMVWRRRWQVSRPPETSRGNEQEHPTPFPLRHDKPRL